MNTFLVIAAVMAAIAAAAVALPLLRDRQSRVLGALLAVLVIGAAAGLYPLWSNWNWHAPAQSEAAAGPDVAAMVAKLEKRLHDHPTISTGWLMLGTLLSGVESLGRCHRRLRSRASARRQERRRRHGTGRGHEPAGGRRYHAAGRAAVRGGPGVGARTIRRRCCTAASPPRCAAIARSRARAGRRSRICIRRRRSSKCSMRASRSWGARGQPRSRRRGDRRACGRGAGLGRVRRPQGRARRRRA